MMRNHNPEELQMLYDLVPAVECKGLCWPQCSLIPVLPAEIDNLPPTPIMDSHMGLLLKPAAWEDGAPICPFLIKHRCSVYAKRPLICRGFGTIEAADDPDHPMVCPHGCKIDHPLSPQQLGTIMQLGFGLSKKRGKA